MTLKNKIIIAIFLSVLLVGGFMFKNSIVDFYNTTSENLHNFQKSDLTNIINQVKEEILAPTPLNIGGAANNAVLVGAQIITQTNLQRLQNGNLPALKNNAKLEAAAKAKAQDMFAKQYFEHVSPTGVDPGVLVKNAGYEYIVTGENLILGNFKDEKEVVQLWMNSPGHRANILNNRFMEIGVAILKGEYKGHTVWIGVQEFGLPLSVCPPQPSANMRATIEANEKKLDELAAQIDVKRKEIEATNKNSPQYNQRVNEYNALVAQYNPLNDQTKALITQYNAATNAFNSCVAGR